VQRGIAVIEVVVKQIPIRILSEQDRKRRAGHEANHGREQNADPHQLGSRSIVLRYNRNTLGSTALQTPLATPAPDLHIAKNRRQPLNAPSNFWLSGEPYSPIATEQDIYYCFRLLLGRNPSSEEWAGHSGLAGNELRGVLRSYLDSREFANRGLIEREPSQDISLTRTPEFSIYTSRDDLAVGKHVAAGAYEPQLADLLRRKLSSGMSVVDLGANIGFFTMLAASLVGPSGTVLAVEPNLANVRMIEASRRVNNFDQVTIAACALGNRPGILALNTAFSNGMTGPVGSALEEVMAAPIVPCLPLAALLPPDRRVEFIKIDVEGAEHAALAGSRALLTRWHPLIASEFSPELLRSNSGVSGVEYLEFFAGLGYSTRLIGAGDDAPAMTPAEVMQAYERNGEDHIDIWFELCWKLGDAVIRRRSVLAC